MRADHLKGWLAEASNKGREDTTEEQTTASEETKAVPNGTGGEGTEERRGKIPAEVSKWKRVVDLVHAAFGEEWIAEEKIWQAVVLIPKGKGTTVALASWR